ncbi:MAG: hypothetical protein JNM46_01175 [Anaerolineales bacterium]|nr:hypothetical protein [Anaerolineales bacterium]
MIAKRRTFFKHGFEITTWKYMRLSAILLVPLVWIHAILNTLIAGPENINLNYVAMRWSSIGWRIYSTLLLAFAFSHGITGFRQILFDFATNSTTRRILNLFLFFFWIVLSLVGATGIISGVGK